MEARRARVALVMPVRNEEAAVELTLMSVLASRRLPDECIVADGLSVDQTVEKIERLRDGVFRERGIDLRIVPNRELWAGSGRNRAIEATSCDIVLLADFGNPLDPLWVERMIRPFETDPTVDVVTGMFLPREESDYEHCVGAIHYFDNTLVARLTEKERLALVPKVVAPGGLSIALTRKIWQRAGGLPEWLPKAQDKLFSRKLYALGATVAIAWDAYVKHHMRSTPGALFKQMFLYGRGNGQSRYVSKHFLKLTGFYSINFCLLALWTLSWVFPTAAIPLIVAYLYRAGWQKLRVVDGKIKKSSYLWLAPLVVFPRDLGVMLGHVVGWLEWLFIPRYRRLFWGYVKDCPPDRLPVLAR
jgi:cellulose synthase/poly-beta-1,6-N-acetylglucosamine synthase-like glycosyltransferase